MARMRRSFESTSIRNCFAGPDHVVYPDVDVVPVQYRERCIRFRLYTLFMSKLHVLENGELG
jgi:hypothetical protein